MVGRRRCPKSSELSRAFTDGADAALEVHLEQCERCASEWNAMATLVRVGRELPSMLPGQQQREAVRTAILAAADESVPSASSARGPARGRWRWPAAGALAAAAAIALWLSYRPLPAELEIASPVIDSPVIDSPAIDSKSADAVATARPSHHRAALSTSSDADFVHETRLVTETRAGLATTDEVVRLKQGRARVSVDHLVERERFRVVTSDAEVEVRGTAFDVEVEHDQLVEVWVQDGVVEVRRRGDVPMLLYAGDYWSLHTGLVRAYSASAVPMRQSPMQQSILPPGPLPLPLPVTRPSASDTAKKIPPKKIPNNAAPVRKAKKRVAIKTPTSAGKAGEKAAPASESESEKDQTNSAEPGGNEPPLPYGWPKAAASATERSFEAGWRALRAKDYQRAALFFERAIAANSDDPLAQDAGYWRAIALARCQRRAAARQAMREFIARYPGSSRAGELSVMLGWSLIEAGNPEAARPHFQRASSQKSRKIADAARAGLREVERAGK